MNTKRKFKSEYMAKVILEIFKEHSSIKELSKKYDLNPSQSVFGDNSF